MGMVFCRSCGHSIHDTAPRCPACGAAQRQLSIQATATDQGWGDALAWVIACAPLIGAIAQAMFSAVTGYRGAWLGLIVLGLNAYLCTADEQRLRERGVDTSTLGGRVFLIPAYLFGRARLLGEKPAYGIVWCVLFGLQFLGGL